MSARAEIEVPISCCRLMLVSHHPRERLVEESQRLRARSVGGGGVALEEFGEHHPYLADVACMCRRRFICHADHRSGCSRWRSGREAGVHVVVTSPTRHSRHRNGRHVVDASVSDPHLPDSSGHHEDAGTIVPMTTSCQCSPRSVAPIGRVAVLASGGVPIAGARDHDPTRTSRGMGTPTALATRPTTPGQNQSPARARRHRRRPRPPTSTRAGSRSRRRRSSSPSTRQGDG